MTFDRISQQFSCHNLYSFVARFYLAHLFTPAQGTCHISDTPLCENDLEIIHSSFHSSSLFVARLRFLRRHAQTERKFSLDGSPEIHLRRRKHFHSKSFVFWRDTLFTNQKCWRFDQIFIILFCLPFNV